MPEPDAAPPHWTSFAWRYAETGWLFTSSFEYALYGCWMFTIGLGQYFYKGAR
jgi:uncharacterized protein